MRFYWLFFRLDKCLYAHFVKKGMCETASVFTNEVDVGTSIGDCKYFFKFRTHYHFINNSDLYVTII